MNILVDDRRTVDAERINDSRNIVTILPSDLVVTRVTVQSDKYNEKGATICYTVRGHFQIIRSTGRGGYIVRKYNKPDSSKFKFMSEDI